MAGLLHRMGAAAARAREALVEHAYLVTLGAVIAVIAATAMYTGRLRDQEEAGVQAAAQAPELASPAPETTPLPTIAPLTTHAMTSKPGTVWPVSGEVVRAHEPQTPVFWAAIGCFQAHEGVDIAGQAGEDVLAVMDGVVESVTLDGLWGWRIRVSQTDGSMGTYAGLACAQVSPGQSVSRGRVLGTLGDIPCEAELGPHLHYEQTADGQPADPEQLLSGATRSAR